MSEGFIWKLRVNKEEFDQFSSGKVKLIEKPKTAYWNKVFKFEYTKVLLHTGRHNEGENLLINIEKQEKVLKKHAIHLGAIVAKKSTAVMLKIMCRNEYNRHYLYFRRDHRNYSLFHKSVYEAYNDCTVGFGQRVIFLDGDPANCAPENLELVQTSELRNREIEHDEFNLTQQNLPAIIEAHAEEIEKVKVYFGIE